MSASNGPNAVTAHLNANSLRSYDDFIVRCVEPADLVAIDELQKQRGFNIGLHNLELYVRTCKRGWTVAVDRRNNRIIATNAFNVLESIDAHFGYEQLIDNDYRGLGLSRIFKLTPHSPYSQNGRFGNKTLEGLQCFPPDAVFTWKAHCYTGFLPENKTALPTAPTLPRDTRIRPLSFADRSGALVGALLDYDERLLRLDCRRSFLLEYALPEREEHSLTSVAVEKVADGGDVVRGYAVLRMFSDADCFTLSPCYADSPEIGLSLMVDVLTRLLSERPAGVRHEVFMPIYAQNRTSMAFCRRIGLRLKEVQMRNYCADIFESYGRKLDITRVYAYHEYWPI